MTLFEIFLLIPLFTIAQALTGIEEIAPFSEGFAAIKKGEQWGFINTKGDLIIDFRKDLVWDRNADPSTFGIMGVKSPSFKQGRCPV